MTRLQPLEPNPRKHEQVADQLRELVKNHLQPGDPLPSVRTLTGQLHVSMPTLRAAQALLQQEGLIEVVHGKGAYVAEKAHQLRIAVVSELDLFHPRTGTYFPTLANTVTNVLQDRGADVRLYNGRYRGGDMPDSPCAAFWEDVAVGRFDGAVIVNHRSSDYWAQHLKRCPIPIVGSQTGYATNVDQAALVRRAVARLVRDGRQRLACLGWGRTLISDPFREALVAAGMELQPEWVKSDLEPSLPGAGWDEFREVWNARREKPDGMLITDDILFSDAQIAILEMGIRVPDDLQLVVQMNRGSGLHVRLPITALEIDPAENGRHLAGMLEQVLRRELVTIPPPLGFKEYNIELEPDMVLTDGRTMR